MPQQQNQSQSALPENDGLVYSPLADVYDESHLGDQISEHWHFLLSNFQSLGAENLSQRRNKIQRILRDDGATYKAYDESQHRTWGLDPVPYLLDKEAWQPIEAGLLQRATLFDAMFKDIYGAQNLIRDGVIPPEAIFANIGFLRPCFGMSTIADHGLLMHAADMVRTKENHVCILADRTQSPGGAGYALENRTVMGRVFPTLFREAQVSRLAMFFQTLRYRLNQLSSSNELPNIVVLTPGSRNESYFEHAYLANYLGYSLVQGRDLTVRNGRVWTKSLGGLTRVDVIVRGVDDYFCDPAELKSDSYLGVPGLLEVVRSKKVVVANPVGSGVLESPVFLKYIENISQFLLGETLQLPTAKTYWAYDPQDKEYIFDNLSRLIIKPSFKKWNGHSIYGASLSKKAQNELRNLIEQKPLKYVAQEYIAPSYSPSWNQNGFVSRPSVLRTFAVAYDTSYKIMPGGLTRTAQEEDKDIINRQTSGLSKDIWVMASESEQQISLWSEKDSQTELDQQQLATLPSRVVENMFWFGRYALRTEYALRLLRTVFMQLNDSQQLSEEAYKTLLLSVTKVTETFPGFEHPDSVLLKNPEAELMSVILDDKRSGSVMSSLMEMLECAEEVKPLLSADTQRVISDIRDEVSVLENALKYDFASAPEEALDPLVTSLLALSGLVHESMIRGYGWRFIEIGRNLERAYQTISLIRALLVDVHKESDEDVVLETLLLTLETLITYRRRYRARSDAINGLELTMVDDSNPRSLHYLFQELQEHIEALPYADQRLGMTPEKRTVIELLSKVQLADLHTLAKVNDEHERQHLDEFLEAIQDLLNDLAQGLSSRYFDHQEAYQQVQSEKWEDEL